MKLKKGMYIRSKDKAGNQFIRKIVDLPEDTRYGSIVVDKDIHNVLWVSKKNVLKASFDLIDLIKPGDIVNGHKVLQIYKKNILKIRFFEKYLECRSYKSSQPFNLYEKDIKNIVTKEQFEASKYTVERDE